ncbi:MAG: serine/threonine-protein kinase [Planctomycetota bacterium]|nr:serine/threonine-protein kinase [Planctomycetota bacterium]
MASGGMGLLLYGQRTHDAHPVVLKAPKQRDAEARLRFTREAQALASLDHPNVVRLLDIDSTSDGLPLLVLEHINGPNLRQVLQRGTPPLGFTERVANDLARALDHCHRRGIVHRDIKPENVVVQGEGCVVIDFGLALVDVDRAGRRLGQTMTPVGSLLGTPPYVAPEQLGDASQVSSAADIFSFGRLLQECLGEGPSRDPRRQRWLDLSQQMCRLDPRHRPQAKAVLDLIRPSSHARRAATTSAAVRPIIGSVAGGLLCAAGLLAAISWWPHQTSSFKLEGLLADPDGADVTLDLANGEILRIEGRGNTQLRLPGGGKWSYGPLHIQGNANGYVVLRLRDDDGRWQLTVRNDP